MYPRLSDLINNIFGTDLHLFIPTYGFVVAIAFVMGIWVMRREIKVKEKRGIMKPVMRKVLVGAPAGMGELIGVGLISLIIGYKVAGVVVDFGLFSENPQKYVFSMKGSIIGGLLIAAGFVLFRWFEKTRKRLPEPEWREVAVYPHEHSGSLLIIAALAGIIGAKLFHNLEHFDDFLADPAGQLFSFMGLTFYGGLIAGLGVMLWYAKRNQIPLLHLLDSTAPALALSYGVGRIGCMLSGDGCWGIVNTQPKPGWLSWLPDWMWSFNFPHNVIEEGVIMDNCSGQYCRALEHPVFPTSFYDTVIMLVFFVVLIAVRNRVTIPGYLFSIFLVFVGIQRFLIEKIRVNVKYDIWGLEITQAEIISIALIVMGALGFWLFRKHHLKQREKLTKQS